MQAKTEAPSAPLQAVPPSLASPTPQKAQVPSSPAPPKAPARRKQAGQSQAQQQPTAQPTPAQPPAAQQPTAPQQPVPLQPVAQQPVAQLEVAQQPPAQAQSIPAKTSQNTAETETVTYLQPATSPLPELSDTLKACLKVTSGHPLFHPAIHRHGNAISLHRFPVFLLLFI